MQTKCETTGRSRTWVSLDLPFCELFVYIMRYWPTRAHVHVCFVNKATSMLHLVVTVYMYITVFVAALIVYCRLFFSFAFNSIFSYFSK